MRFLVDENLPPGLAAWLNKRGHDAVHVQDCGLLGAGDVAIAAHSKREQRVIITQDADFDRPTQGVRVLRLGVGNAPKAKLLTWLAQRLDIALRGFASGQQIIHLI